ncbi:5-oxoprolinase subunit PxpB [Pararhodonellum marinum]|uniref:5-oxoprolinase subunit PxpB n=1 Tax=Pararhodonellum marinum TaxID=2755358 RepID=UPI00188E48AD|nr:5-oxoprolinase subunit PxpB [Pararhodonellum marinum]
MKFALQFHQTSPQQLEICWPDKISPEILQEMLLAKEVITENYGHELRDLRMGYHQMGCVFKDKFDYVQIIDTLLQVITLPKPKWIYQSWTLPVLYEGKDLESMAHILQLSPNEIVDHHCQNNYLLYFYGFLPGFMYLGGLPEILHLPRKKHPDPLIPKGSVAIGGKQTGVYPLDSPGGWHIIGKCPVSLFRPEHAPPVFAQPGDRIAFYPIQKKDYQLIQKDVTKGNFSPTLVI